MFHAKPIQAHHLLKYADSDEDTQDDSSAAEGSTEDESSSTEETDGEDSENESTENDYHDESDVDYTSSRIGSPKNSSSHLIDIRPPSSANSNATFTSSSDAGEGGGDDGKVTKKSWNCTPEKQVSLLTTTDVHEQAKVTSSIINPPSPPKSPPPGPGIAQSHKHGTKHEKSLPSDRSKDTEGKKKRKRKHRPVTICLTHCRYEIVKSVAISYALKPVGENDAWNIYWTDFSVSLDRAMDMKRFQVVNHFPGMNEICRKDLLARNFNRMKKLFHKDYDIFPKTWSLPADLGDLQTFHATHKNRTYICKPEMGCQGRGIFLVRNIRDLNPFGKIICQLYIQKPFLIDDLKFDLRIYVLLTSCDPLRIYIYNEGLARFATAKYKLPTSHNTENSYMHLTNYAVNKFSRDFVPDDAINGSKRKYSAVLQWLKERNYNTKHIEAQIEDVITKTIITAQPILKHNYKTCFPNHDICSACFEILGFDIIFDMNLKAYVLEVNHSPSFHTDSQIDKEIKENLLRDTFAMFNLKLLDRRKIQGEDRKRVIQRLIQSESRKESQEQVVADVTSNKKEKAKELNWEMKKTGGYRLIYPRENSAIYDKYFEQNLGSIYQGTASSQARVNHIKTQIEEFNLKKQDEEKKRMVSAMGVPAANREREATSKEFTVDNNNNPKYRQNKWPLYTNVVGDSFKAHHIVAEEELERLKGLMQRGIMIRSMGVEVHVYKLLSDMGCIKPKDEKLFRRLHGFTNPYFRMAKNSDYKIEMHQTTNALAPLPTPEVLLADNVSQSQTTSQANSPRPDSQSSNGVLTSDDGSTITSQITREDLKNNLAAYNVSLQYSNPSFNANPHHHFNPYGPRTGKIFQGSKYGGPSIKNLSLGGSDLSSLRSSSSNTKVSQIRVGTSPSAHHFQELNSTTVLPKRIMAEVQRSYERRRVRMGNETYNSGYTINAHTNNVMSPSAQKHSHVSSGDGLTISISGTGDQIGSKRSSINFSGTAGTHSGTHQQRSPATACAAQPPWGVDKGYYYQSIPTGFQQNNSISTLRAPYLAAEVRQNFNRAFGDEEIQYMKPGGNVLSGRLSGRHARDKIESLSAIEAAGVALPAKPKSKRCSTLLSQMRTKTAAVSETQGPMRVTQMFFDSKGLAQPRKQFAATTDSPHLSQNPKGPFDLFSTEMLQRRVEKNVGRSAKDALIMPETTPAIPSATSAGKIIYNNNFDANLRLLQPGSRFHAPSKVGNHG